MSLGQLQRLQATTFIPSSPQNKTRALLAGLVALAKHTLTPVKVIVQVTAVWEVWTQPRHRQPYMDLLEDLTDQDLQRVTVLYVSRNTRTPKASGNEPNLRKRQRDAPFSLASEQTPCATVRPLNGSRSWTMIAPPSTSMQLPDLPRSTQQKITTHIKKCPDIKAGRPSSAKSIWSCNATSLGLHSITARNHTTVGFIAVPLASDCIKHSRCRSLKRDLDNNVRSCALARSNPISVARANHYPRSSPELK